MCVDAGGALTYVSLTDRLTLTTTFPLCDLTDAPNHWCDLNSRGSLVPFTFIILLSGQRHRGSGKCIKTRNRDIFRKSGGKSFTLPEVTSACVNGKHLSLMSKNKQPRLKEAHNKHQNTICPPETDVCQDAGAFFFFFSFSQSFSNKLAHT